METKKEINVYKIAKSFVVGFIIGFALYKFVTIILL
ncbi:hypothetical protein FLA105534_04725 [Flavobacterium bizetiae]|uniref:Uncharacterized protein n=1 Tax=Flavobacterium bizetiae TaxID=2704140 RepID=A0A6J4GXD8_9FLAO|nr:hypothetical protein FLA105534_04725 [Flavobacterium bizetiae]CAD5343972.1 hypothetical protein FLA105535_03974 [Flavobacterium bizetiae]CAD5349237.1 hypothetical protein FLA105534_03221 [Flavobacterium bizetiae]